MAARTMRSASCHPMSIARFDARWDLSLHCHGEHARGIITEAEVSQETPFSLE